MDRLHNASDSNGFLPDHDGEFVGVKVLLIVDAEHLILEDGLVILVTKDDVRPHIVKGMLADGFEGGWVEEGYDVLWFDIRQLFVALHLVFLVEPEAEQPSQVGGD